MVRLFLPLISDVESYGNPVPSDPSTVYDKLDETPDNDGDAMRLRILGAGQTEASGVDTTALPANAVIDQVVVRWAAEQSATGTARMRAGLRLDGVDHWGATRNPSSVAYSIFEEAFPTDPRTGLAWLPADLREDLAAIAQATQMPNEPGFPRLSQRVVYVDYTAATNVSGARLGAPRSRSPRLGAPRSRSASARPRVKGTA
jgi:hypothetical protein